MRRREFLGTMAGAMMLAGCATSSAERGFKSGRITVEPVGSGPDVVLIPGLATFRGLWAGIVASVPGYRYHLVEVAGSNGTDPGANRAPGP